jgi:hypothetical protein
MIDLALYLKRNGYRPRQVQDFIPAPMDVATCMYYTGLDPMTMQPVAVARATTDRKMQRALLQFFKPENYFETRRALLHAGRGDLIGDGCDALIPATPPREAIGEARGRANTRADRARRRPRPGRLPPRTAAAERGRLSSPTPHRAPPQVGRARLEEGAGPDEVPGQAKLCVALMTQCI